MKYTDSKSAIEDSGYVYGGQAGIAWNVLREVDFDLSYRYSISILNKVDDVGRFGICW